MTTHEPILIAQISDLHIGAHPQALARLATVVAAVAALAPVPVAVLVTGDLTEHGTPAEYALVRDALAPLAMPVHVMPGNHDDRDVLRAELRPPIAPDAPPPFVQYAVECGGVRLVVCDTTETGHDGGALDAARLAWLEVTLSADRETTTIVAMHHPPLLTGVPAMDELRLADDARAALDRILHRFPQVRLVVAGHVHRTVVGSLGGCAVFACPSTDGQLLLDLAGRSPLAIVEGDPAFAVHALVGGELVTHVEPVASG